MCDTALLYILHHFDFWLDELITKVINDSDDDPQFSAVTTTNCIKCFIEVMHGLKQLTDCSNVQDYILQAGFSESEYETFEKKRYNESQYYLGEQF